MVISHFLKELFLDIWPFQFCRVYLINFQWFCEWIRQWDIKNLPFSIWSELYLDPCQTSMVELFHKNSYWLLVVNYFPKKPVPINVSSHTVRMQILHLSQWSSNWDYASLIKHERNIYKIGVSRKKVQSHINICCQFLTSTNYGCGHTSQGGENYNICDIAWSYFWTAPVSFKVY